LLSTSSEQYELCLNWIGKPLSPFFRFPSLLIMLLGLNSCGAVEFLLTNYAVFYSLYNQWPPFRLGDLQELERLVQRLEKLAAV
jgi:hypothetical protein